MGAGVVKIVQKHADLLEKRAGRRIVISAVSARSRAKNRDLDLSAYAWEDDPVALARRKDVDLFIEFFQGFVNHAPATLHIDNLAGQNAHHIAETMFKAFGRALRFAVSKDERMQGVIPSTKGSL